MIIFNGVEAAQQRELELTMRVAKLRKAGSTIGIAAIYFVEDQGSQLYTRLKTEAANRVGISYDSYAFSLTDDLTPIVAKLASLAKDVAVTGIIIQKPWRKIWYTAQKAAGYSFTTTHEASRAYDSWWHTLTQAIEVTKDVDGLHPATLAAIKAGTWRSEGRVLPATARAVLAILAEAAKQTQINPQTHKTIIIGKSDLLGYPLFFELQGRGGVVELIGTKEFTARKESAAGLTDAAIVISATGVSGLVTGELVKEGSVIIDVGEPKPDVDFDTVAAKASFITPVPGGVGPLTVVSLLENAVFLASRK